jgi:hypothetical protein
LAVGYWLLAKDKNLTQRRKGFVAAATALVQPASKGSVLQHCSNQGRLVGRLPFLIPKILSI